MTDFYKKLFNIGRQVYKVDFYHCGNGKISLSFFYFENRYYIPIKNRGNKEMYTEPINVADIPLSSF